VGGEAAGFGAMALATGFAAAGFAGAGAGLAAAIGFGAAFRAGFEAGFAAGLATGFGAGLAAALATGFATGGLAGLDVALRRASATCFGLATGRAALAEGFAGTLRAVVPLPLACAFMPDNSPAAGLIATAPPPRGP
jgi:hypothetical protein